MNVIVNTNEESQDVTEPTHEIHGSSPCIDLIFCSNSKVAAPFGVEQSLFSQQNGV